MKGLKIIKRIVMVVVRRRPDVTWKNYYCLLRQQSSTKIIHEFIFPIVILLVLKNVYQLPL